MNYTTLPIGRHFAANVSSDYSVLTLYSDVPALNRAIRALEHREHGVEYVVYGVSRSQAVLVLPHPMRYTAKDSHIVACARVRKLTTLTSTDSVNTLMTTHVNDVVPWQREQLRIYQLNNAGYTP